jgi:hypothetical protein
MRVSGLRRVSARRFSASGTAHTIPVLIHSPPRKDSMDKLRIQTVMGCQQVGGALSTAPTSCHHYTSRYETVEVPRVI